MTSLCVFLDTWLLILSCSVPTAFSLALRWLVFALSLPPAWAPIIHPWELEKSWGVCFLLLGHTTCKQQLKDTFCSTKEVVFGCLNCHLACPFYMLYSAWPVECSYSIQCVCLVLWARFLHAHCPSVHSSIGLFHTDSFGSMLKLEACCFDVRLHNCHKDMEENACVLGHTETLW